MKTTTTVKAIIQSELIKSGENEFFNDNQLTFYDKDYSFIQKILNYDNDIEKVVNDVIFKDISLTKQTSDKKFKQAFVNRFMNREIGYQTLESFASQVVYTVITHYDYLNVLFDNIDDYTTGKKTSDTDDNMTEFSDNRHADSSLPQNQVNIDVDDTILEYADTNAINRSKNERIGNNKNQSHDYNIDDLIKSNNLIHEVFIEFDKNCFLQIW